MTDIWLKRTPAGVTPVEMDDLPKGWRIGDDLLANIRKPRNIRLHKKAFALAKVVYGHSDYPSIEAVRKALTIGAGYVDDIINPTGKIMGF